LMPRRFGFICGRERWRTRHDDGSQDRLRRLVDDNRILVEKGHSQTPRIVKR
jgi:hypothetical protein